MPSISYIVRDLVKSKPMVYEGLIEGVISHAALAESIQADVEKELGKDVQLPAIVMAIRRYSENLQEKTKINTSFQFKSEIIMKTGLADVALVKSPSLFGKLKQLYTLVDYSKGDTLNINYGNYEITIVISEKYLEEVKKILEGEEILNIEQDLVSLSVGITKDFMYTPGVLAKVTRKLAWENINAFENISTMTELIFIIAKKDSIRAYKALQNLVDSEK